MFDSKLVRNLAFVSRQISTELKKTTVDDALSRVRAATPDTYQDDVTLIGEMLAGNMPKKASLGASPYQMLTALLKTPGVQRTELFCEFVDYVRQTKAVFDTAWAGVVGLLWYLTALSVTAFTAILIFRSSVLPAFSNMLLGADNMPLLTQRVFGNVSAGVPLLVLLSLAVVLVAAVAFLIVFRRIQMMAPLPHRLHWLPIIGRLASTYNLGLFLNFVRILKHSGCTEQDAIRAASDATGLPADFLPDDAPSNTTAVTPELAELAIARKLGNLSQELDHQCEAFIGTLAAALATSRDRFAISMKVVLFAMVGLLVIAMYLPIFKMGSVV